ncbi:hypothetical protein [Dysgonomonas sp.]
MRNYNLSKIIISGIIIILPFISCNNEIKEVNLNLSGLNMGTEFRIDTINTNDWDSLFIVKPYAIIDSNKYNIPKSVLKKIEFQTLFDGYCSLLFFKNKQLINYSFIPRNISDFSQIKEGSLFPSHQIYKLNDKRLVVIL